MAYIVNRRDGVVIATIADGTLDTTSTSITLLGKGFNNYGEIVAEDWVHILENFSNNTPPNNALRGQVWFDPANNRLHVNISSVFGSPEWVSIGKAYVQATQPDDTAGEGFDIGTFWWDLSTSRLNISIDGTTFTPLRTVNVGTPPPSPSEGDLFYDTTTKQLKVYNSLISAFDVIGPARSSATMPATSLQDGDEWWDSSKKQLHIWDGNANEFRLIGPLAEAGAGDTGIEIGNVDGNSLVFVKVNGDIVGIWSDQDFTPSGVIVGFDDVVGGPTPLRRGLNLAPNNGPSSEQTVLQGLATEAQYADLAERYAADMPTEAGDLVKMGGEAEITKTTNSCDIDVFGVVSTQPGLKLNALAGPDETHPFIALAGRVPCKIIGSVKKGDRLASSDISGVAKAVDNETASQNILAIFGRALETDDNEGIKLVEVAIGVK